MSSLDKKNLDNLSHSASHLLAAAVLELWPEAKPTIGPPIEDGFYYDFDNLKLTTDDLQRIEEKMQEIVKKWKSFEKIEVSQEQAKEQFKDNKYKQELIDEFAKEGQQLTLYKAGDFVDLCRGGHVDNPAKELKHFKLLSMAGAYWRGDEHNKMLTRIYGTAWPSKKELDAYLKMREEAKQRDHRKLGKELDLFTFADEVGPGLPLLTAKGTTIRRELERFTVDEEIKRGYQHVYTPDLARVKLYEISGHYPYYKDTMYPVMQVDEDKLVLRPMSCPHHFMLYARRPRSYRELPLKIAEIAKLYRYEKSGELSGLMRVRSFCLADSHIFCTEEQASEVIKNVIELIDFMADKLGLKKGKAYWFRLSLGDRNKKEKYFDNPQSWEQGESCLRQVLDEIKAPYEEVKDDAAFYGPKIDIQMKNVNGKEDTAFTVQYDFCLPSRFKLKYINEKGEEKQPLVIHRSSIGSLERTMAFLIEHYAGAFPLWLAPVQVQVIPVSETYHEYSAQLAQELKANNIRVHEDMADETVGNKIRKAEQDKVPYMLVVGEKEVQGDKLSIRVRGKKQTKEMDKKRFIRKVVKEIENKK